MDGEDARVGARGVGGRARARRGAAHQRVPHARARHHIPDDRPELAGLTLLLNSTLEVEISYSSVLFL